MYDVEILGRDILGPIALNGSIIYRLTNCCEASGKGSGNGVICRGCYRPVVDEYGRAWLTRDSALVPA